MQTSHSFIYLRHGRTEANDRGLCSGAYCPHPLTEEGRVQIAKAAAFLGMRGIAPSVLFLSPSVRTTESAAIFLSHEKFSTLCSIPLEGLRERHMGAWEGKAFEGIRAALLAGDIGEGGEGDAEFHDRIQNSFEYITNSGHSLPLVISHGFVWQALHDVHKTEAPWIENGDLYKVTKSISGFISEKIE